MAERRPLCRVNGANVELPLGDKLPISTAISFTPTIAPITLGDWSVTYTVQSGLMISYGPLAYVEVALTFMPTFTSAASGALRVATLPLPAVTTLGTLQFQEPTSNITWPSSSTMMIGRVASLTDLSALYVFGLRSAGTASALAAANIVSGATTRFNLAGWIRIA